MAFIESIAWTRDIGCEGTELWQDYGTEVDMYMANKGCFAEW